MPLVFLSVHHLIFILPFVLHLVIANSGVSTSIATDSYTKLITTTVTDATYSTYISSLNGTSTYYFNNQSYIVSTDGYLTVTNCPCTFTSLSVVTEKYTDVSYASGYWITHTTSSNSTTYSNSTSSSSSSTLTTFVQNSESSSQNKALNELGTLKTSMVGTCLLFLTFFLV